MKTEFKDVEHLYKELKCVFTISGETKEHEEYGILIGSPRKGTECYVEDAETKDVYRAFIHEIKPILRPLSNMSNEEESYLNKHGFGVCYPSYRISDEEGREASMTIFESAFVTQYLLSKHFDLFALISTNQAIDATK